MQILGRASEDFTFFGRATPPKAPSPSPSSPPAEADAEPTTSGLAPLEFMSKATSALRSASSRARRALAELKDDIVGDIVIDFGGTSQQQQQQHLQGPGWSLPWATKSEEEKQIAEVRRRVRELSKEPYRFLVARTEASEDWTCCEMEELVTAAETAMEADERLACLKEELVPRMLSDVEFWNRYFQAVKEIKEEARQKSTVVPGHSVLVACSATSSAVTDWIPTPWAGTSGRQAASRVRVINLDEREDESRRPQIASATVPRSVSSCGGPASGVGESSSTTAATRWSSEGAGGDEPGCAGRVEGAMGLAGGGGFGSTIIGQECGVSLEQGLEDQHFLVRREQAEEDPNPFHWLKRTVSGISSISGSQVEQDSRAVTPDRTTPGILSPPEATSPRAANLRTVKPLPACGMPPSSSLQHLCTAAMSAAGFRSCKDLLLADASVSADASWPVLGPLLGSSTKRQAAAPASSREQSPQRWPPSSAAAEGCADGVEVARSEDMQHILVSLFDPVTMSKGALPDREGTPGKGFPCITRTLHGAPPGSFVAELAWAMTGLQSLQEMAQLWLEVVARLRLQFKSGEYIPRVHAVGEQPDLQQCELMQHLQVLNLCMWRREKRALELADFASRPENEGGTWAEGEGPKRRGVKEQSAELFLLESGEPLCIPETQDTPLMTETSVRESEEAIMKTGSLSSGCKQLFSDMQAFKAANPGCLLEDFVRWYSPPDWSPVPYSPHSIGLSPSCESDEWPRTPGSTAGPTTLASAATSAVEGGEQGLLVTPTGQGAHTKGYLSVRMTFPGNQWQELWSEAKAIPAIEQPRLFNVEEGGETSLRWLEELPPSDLLEQLFITLVGVGLSAAQALPEAAKEPLRTSLVECSRYAAAACSRGMGSRKHQLLGMVYEILETARATTSLLPLFQSRPVQSQQPEDGGNRQDGNQLCAVTPAATDHRIAESKGGGHSGEECSAIPSSDEASVGCCAGEGEGSEQGAVQGLRADIGTPFKNLPEVAASYPIAETSVVEPSVGYPAPVDGGRVREQPEPAQSLRQAAASLFQRVRKVQSWNRPPMTIGWPLVAQTLRVSQSHDAPASSGVLPERDDPLPFCGGSSFVCSPESVLMPGVLTGSSSPFSEGLDGPETLASRSSSEEVASSPSDATTSYCGDEPDSPLGGALSEGSVCCPSGQGDEEKVLETDWVII